LKQHLVSMLAGGEVGTDPDPVSAGIRNLLASAFQDPAALAALEESTDRKCKESSLDDGHVVQLVANFRSALGASVYPPIIAQIVDDLLADPPDALSSLGVAPPALRQHLNSLLAGESSAGDPVAAGMHALLATAFADGDAMAALDDSTLRVCRRADLDDDLAAELGSSFRHSLGAGKDAILAESPMTPTLSPARRSVSSTCGPSSPKSPEERNAKSVATQSGVSGRASPRASPKRGVRVSRSPDRSVQRLANRIAHQLAHPHGAFPFKPNQTPPRSPTRLRASSRGDPSSS